ncbi:hypothetical protein BD410DRAFT_855550 [Rickenella mellea]|uniref:Uncharacterized protein n=1 Tax=Rickenella mellea TaxID=50990 RepID=A0A4Y7Q8W5_9AGAM|nr:hypothetical protein BD410DRAFT_855550 [Rickenella mellea]
MNSVFLASSICEGTILESMITITDDLEIEEVQSGDEVSDDGVASDPDEFKDLQPLSTLLHRRLVVESQPVVFIGESHTRSLPIALAILRGSLEGIWATSREPLEKTWTFSEFDTLLDQQLAQAEINWKLKKVTMPHAHSHKVFQLFEAFKRYLSKIWTQVTELLERFIEGVDATNLQGSFEAPNSAKPTCNLWFQCPWHDKWDGSYPGFLLKSFVVSAAEVQVPGDMLIIGLTTHQNYVDKYDLGHGGFMEHATLCGYKLLVDNDRLIDKILDLGYRHVGLAEIHWSIFDTYVTYVFVKLNVARPLENKRISAVLFITTEKMMIRLHAAVATGTHKYPELEKARDMDLQIWNILSSAKIHIRRTKAPFSEELSVFLGQALTLDEVKGYYGFNRLRQMIQLPRMLVSHVTALRMLRHPRVTKFSSMLRVVRLQYT